MRTNVGPVCAKGVDAFGAGVAGMSARVGPCGRMWWTHVWFVWPIGPACAQCVVVFVDRVDDAGPGCTHVVGERWAGVFQCWARMDERQGNRQDPPRSGQGLVFVFRFVACFLIIWVSLCWFHGFRVSQIVTTHPSLWVRHLLS